MAMGFLHFPFWLDVQTEICYSGVSAITETGGLKMSKKVTVGQGSTTCRNEIAKYMRTQCSGVTAYKIARKTGYTPQWVNKVLCQMWASGLYAYRVVPYGRGEKREWIFAYSDEGQKAKGDEWVFAYSDRLI